MNKDRKNTGRIDYLKVERCELIKEWITEGAKANVLDFLEANNEISLHTFFNIFKEFVYSNHASRTSGSERQHEVFQIFEKNKLISPYSYGTIRNKYDKDLDSTSLSQQKNSFDKMLSKFILLKNEKRSIKKIMDSLAEEGELEGKEFSDLCKIYNLKIHLEKNRRKDEFQIKKRAYGVKPKTEKQLIVSEIKYLQKLSKYHFKGRNYSNDNLRILEEIQVLTFAKYDNQKVLNKIQELQNFIQ